MRLGKQTAYIEGIQRIFVWGGAAVQFVDNTYVYVYVQI